VENDVWLLCLQCHEFIEDCFVVSAAVVKLRIKKGRQTESSPARAASEASPFLKGRQRRFPRYPLPGDHELFASQIVEECEQ